MLLKNSRGAASDKPELILIIKILKMETRECCDCGHKYKADDAFMNRVWDGDLQVHITHEVCPECFADDYYLKDKK